MKTRFITTAALACLLLGVLAPSALAHATISANPTTAGSYSLFTVSVGHGCDGAATTSLEVKFEDDYLSVTPYRSALWEVEENMRELDEPVEGPHGEQVTEVTDTVVYTATEPLPDGIGDSVKISVRLPEDAAGETLYFPILQKCEGGKQTNWAQVPAEGEDPHELDTPAASVAVTEGGEGGHGGGGDDGDDGDESAAAGGSDTEELDTVRMMAIIGIALGTLGLILALLGLRARIKARD